MKKQLLLVTVLLLGLKGHAQITFEKGYFINNKNQKISCLIKNIDWKNNPKTFKYKTSESSEIQLASIETVKEFAIDQQSKYIRAKVALDRSHEDLNNLSLKRSPVFKTEVLFLKVLVMGSANLYFFEDGSLRRYFYNKGKALTYRAIDFQIL